MRFVSGVAASAALAPCAGAAAAGAAGAAAAAAAAAALTPCMGEQSSAAAAAAAAARVGSVRRSKCLRAQRDLTRGTFPRRRDSKVGQTIFERATIISIMLAAQLDCDLGVTAPLGHLNLTRPLPLAQRRLAAAAQLPPRPRREQRHAPFRVRVMERGVRDAHVDASLNSVLVEDHLEASEFNTLVQEAPEGRVSEEAEEADAAAVAAAPLATLPPADMCVARRVVARWRAFVAERKGVLLLRVLQELPDLFFEEVLRRLGPTDRTMLAQVGWVWSAAVLASGFPRWPTGSTVRLRLRDFCTSVERLSWARANGLCWVVPNLDYTGLNSPCAFAACLRGAPGGVAVGAGARLPVGLGHVCMGRSRRAHGGVAVGVGARCPVGRGLRACIRRCRRAPEEAGDVAGRTR